MILQQSARCGFNGRGGSKYNNVKPYLCDTLKKRKVV
uniref:Uncharacterized protein n=1 Tax=Siphoviridae sp. ct2ZW1 TaxID=2825316 RepID=A0A8S5Q9I3_9CAUD|nr:MAG TPA: hypothetical protein [Siphoviridae sp. ct2ZW1]